MSVLIFTLGNYGDLRHFLLPAPGTSQSSVPQEALGLQVRIQPFPVPLADAGRQHSSLFARPPARVWHISFSFSLTLKSGSSLFQTF